MDPFWQYFLGVTRFLHIAAGVLWIGLLYYFNFVQVPAFAKMDPAARTNAIAVLVPRALLFFRMAAAATVLFGVLYIGTIASQTGSGYWTSSRFYSIVVGGTLGIIMAANVWFIIWPNQKKIVPAAQAGKPPDPTWGRKASLASRTNVMFSIPMLFFMVGAIHMPRLFS